MTEERRYSEDEVEEIFEAASSVREANPRALASADGFTLAELQAIGLEAGLAPERVAEAARDMERRHGALAPRRFLGMPMSVGRVVELPRAPTDREWELLVAELRETFQARGKVGSSAAARHWSNGNLHAFVEPTESGYRLRLGTRKGDAAALNYMGAVGFVMAAVMAVVFALSGNLGQELAVPLMFSLMGLGALGANAIRLPPWAREREGQMEYIAVRARELIAPSPTEEEGPEA